MNVNELFKNAYIKAEDLEEPITVTIDEAEIEELGERKEKKLVLSFSDHEQKLAVNKTNAKTLVKLFGDDTDSWLGQKITLGAREVDFKGESVMAVRVSPKKPGASKTETPF
jgi:hypothetical protein